MMRLRHVACRAADPTDLLPFYAETLGLPTVDTADGFAVRVGASTVEFRDCGDDPTYHLAFSVAGDADAAVDWLDARTDLLRDGDEERFRYDWLDATAVYFADPAGNVLELLVRDGQGEPTVDFGPDRFLEVAEVGLVVADVAGTARALADAFDLPPPDDDPDFCYLGGRDGAAFVLAAPGRDWFPTDRPAASHPVTVVAEAGSGTVSAPDGPVAVLGVGE